jgi:TRAP-type C4-dicarboxylate transport system permease small subunit
MDRVYDFISKVCFILAGLALVVMTVIFAWLVFGRYVLNDTPTWVEQVSLLLLMVISFFGAAAGVHQHTHLSVVVFRNIVPSWVRTFFVIVTDLAMATFGGMMVWYGAELTLFKWKTLIPLIQWSEGLRSLPLTIAGLLIFLFSSGHLLRVVLGYDRRLDNIDQG